MSDYNDASKEETRSSGSSAKVPLLQYSIFWKILSWAKYKLSQQTHLYQQPHAPEIGNAVQLTSIINDDDGKQELRQKSVFDSGDNKQTMRVRSFTWSKIDGFANKCLSVNRFF